MFKLEYAIMRPGDFTGQLYQRHEFEERQSQHPLDYTITLTQSRAHVGSLGALRDMLLKEALPFLSPPVIEIGPGAIDILFTLMGGITPWYAVDISPKVIDALQLLKCNSEFPSDYHVKNVSLHGAHADVPQGSVIGLCSYDSMNAMQEYANATYNITAPGSHVVLVQDLGSSHDTLAAMLYEDERTSRGCGLLKVREGEDVETTTWTHIQVDNKWRDSRLYMMERWQHYFARAGFLRKVDASLKSFFTFPLGYGSMFSYSEQWLMENFSLPYLPPHREKAAVLVMKKPESI